MLRIEGVAGETAQLNLVDALGRVVLTHQLVLEGTTDYAFDVLGLPSGPYALFLLCENGERAVKPLLIGGR